MITDDSNFMELIDGWRDLKENLSCFLGAGASIGARNTSGAFLPSAYDLRNLIWQRFMLGENAEKFNPSDLKLMSLEHAGAIVEAKVGRARLASYIREVFDCDKPLWQHLALPYLNSKTLLTTNYDELIELGYQSNLKKLEPIYNDRTPVPGHTILYKPHGGLTHSNQEAGKGGLILTQFDYMEMIAEYREMLSSTMSGLNNTCVLIIGYSFGDMDIGAELYRMRKLNRDVPWYAIFPRNDPRVKRMYEQKFDIRQINATFEDFIAGLDQMLDILPAGVKHNQIHDLKKSNKIQ